jgi:proline dehydrogenase
VSALDYILSRSLPFVPRPVVRSVSRPYIAGDTLQDAVGVVRALNSGGVMATLDVLGERVCAAEKVEAAFREYQRCLQTIRQERLDSNISIKLTQMGLKLDPGLCATRVRSLALEAGESGNFVRIDMEDSSCTTATLDLYRRLRSEGIANIGVVLQACLRRSLEDARALPAGTNVRLCKGIYVEPRSVAYTDRPIVNKNYCRILLELLDRGSYVGIATHDEDLVFEASMMIDRLRLSRQAYEFQMLLGVDRDLREMVRKEGHRLRVYVPFGSHWYAYSIRRLKENPRLAGYILKALIGGRRG